MATVTKTAPTFSTIESTTQVANGNMGTLRTLDLTTKFGATLLVWIGRRAGTTPSRAAYVAIRNTDNNTRVFPGNATFDVVNQGPTTAAAATTLTAAAAANQNQLTVAATTNFAVGDVVLISGANGARAQWGRIVQISGSVITLERDLRAGNDNGDNVVSLADARRVNLPGGDVYEIRCINYSGVDCVFAVEAITDEGETIN
jgi:hypothetical protein